MKEPNENVNTTVETPVKKQTVEDFINDLNLSDEDRRRLLNNKGLTATSLLVPKVYSECFYDNYKKFLLSSGRLSGKTSILVALWWVYINKYEDRDVVILQSTSTEIKDSIIVEIEKFLRNSGFDVSDNLTSEWYIPKKHNLVQHRGCKNSTKIFPITDSRGGQRARGIATENKLSLILFEEVQKNKDKNVVEQALLTFVRQVEDGAKIVVVGNNETVGHWFTDFVEEKRQDDSWCYIYANCYDIWNLLNETTKEYVENFKKVNYTEFRRIFLGDINANTSDVVFPQFTRAENYKRVYELEKHYISKLIVGIDHATANDTFAIVPVAVLDNGTTQTLEVCFDDPKETNRTLAPTEQCEILEQFMDFLDNKYGIAFNQLETILSVDGAASPFIAQLRHLKKTAKNRKLWSNILIKGFTMKKKDINLGIIKNAFAFNVLIILNEGKDDWRGKPNPHRLAKEIEKQRYKGGKLDPSIPNDLCDALEYGLIPFYSNCYNLSFPIRKAQANAHYDEIRKLANMK